MDEFGGLFKDLGAFPEELWADPDMLDLVLPPVIADFRIAAQYETTEPWWTARWCPTPAVDPLLVEPGAMTTWTERSRRYLGHHEYPGGHFYVSDHAAGRHVGLHPAPDADHGRPLGGVLRQNPFRRPLGRRAAGRTVRLAVRQRGSGAQHRVIGAQAKRWVLSEDRVE